MTPNRLRVLAQRAELQGHLVGDRDILKARDLAYACRARAALKEMLVGQNWRDQ